MAAARPSWCTGAPMRFVKASSRPMATTSSFAWTRPTATATFFCCRSRETGSRCRSSSASMTTSIHASLPTRSGSRTSPISRAGRKCMSVRSGAAVRAIPSRPMAVVNRSGPPMERRLYYRMGARMMAARIVTSPSFAVVARDTLFEGPYTTDPWHPNYDVMPDGKGFVMVRPVEQDRQLVLVMNWGEELRQRTRSRH